MYLKRHGTELRPHESLSLLFSDWFVFFAFFVLSLRCVNEFLFNFHVFGLIALILGLSAQIRILYLHGAEPSLSKETEKARSLEIATCVDASCNPSLCSMFGVIHVC